MSPTPPASALPGADHREVLSRVAGLGSDIGFDIVEVEGFLDRLDAEAQGQLDRLAEVRRAAEGMVSATGEREQVAEIAAASEAGLALVLRSVEKMRAGAVRARTVAEWVQGLAERMEQIEGTVRFCAAVNLDRYLPTHNARFSRPQSADPVWNAAKCRNRRIFANRVGLKAGRNTTSFLMQTYRRAFSRQRQSEAPPQRASAASPAGPRSRSIPRAAPA